MTEETQALLADLRAVYGELFPYRNPTHWEPHDDLLVLGAYLKREIQLRLPVKKLPAGFAEGAEPQPSARAKRR